MRTRADEWVGSLNAEVLVYTVTYSCTGCAEFKAFQANYSNLRKLKNVLTGR